MAVDDAILSWDGVTTFHVGDDGSSANHNFFYEEPMSGMFRLNAHGLLLIDWMADLEVLKRDLSGMRARMERLLDGAARGG
ncbi:hypothetical protein [Sorangium sp. So ce1389]|uniref:hypothetical protein n=1 Tax=Sorangium sp. So ce1389 TaxID=3133336 RepID=UPI003F5DA321